MYLEPHPDKPEWLSHVNASVLKVKLKIAIIGIPSIHLLKTFINANAYNLKTLLTQEMDSYYVCAVILGYYMVRPLWKLPNEASASPAKIIHSILILFNVAQLFVTSTYFLLFFFIENFIAIRHEYHHRHRPYRPSYQHRQRRYN